jgi:hypothetical protein
VKVALSRKLQGTTLNNKEGPESKRWRDGFSGTPLNLRVED